MNKTYTLKGLYVGKYGEEKNPTYYGTLDGAIQYASNSMFTHHGEDVIICIGEEDFAIQRWFEVNDETGKGYETEGFVKIPKSLKANKSKKTSFEFACDLWEHYLDCIGLKGKDCELIKTVYQLSMMLTFDNEGEKKEWIRAAIHYEERRNDDTFEWESNTEKKILTLKPQEEKKESPKYSKEDLMRIGKEVASGWGGVCLDVKVNSKLVEFMCAEHGEHFTTELTWEELKEYEYAL